LVHWALGFDIGLEPGSKWSCVLPLRNNTQPGASPKLEYEAASPAIQAFICAASSRQREQRLADLLRALARASKLSSQGSTIDETFERICQVCAAEIGAAATLVFEAGPPAFRACAGCSPDDARALLVYARLRSGIDAAMAAGHAAFLSTPDLLVARASAPFRDPQSPSHRVGALPLS